MYFANTTNGCRAKFNKAHKTMSAPNFAAGYEYHKRCFIRQQWRDMIYITSFNPLVAPEYELLYLTYHAIPYTHIIDEVQSKM